MLILLTVIMFFVAIFFSMFGQGGGVLYTPIQVWSGIDFHTASTTSLFMIMVLSLSAASVFRKAHKIDWPLVLVLESSTLLGSFAGGLWSGQFSEDTLTILFVGIVTLSAVFMTGSFHTNHSRKQQRSTRFSWHRQTDNQTYRVNLMIALPASFVVGLTSGMAGIGGGILKVPMMVLLFGIPMDIAVGSSALMVGVTATGGFAGHLLNDHWDWKTSLVFAVAVFAGGQIGSRFSLGIDKSKLKKIFGGFLFVIAALMLARLFA